MNELSDAAILEIADLQSKAQTLAHGNTEECLRAKKLVRRVNAIRRDGISSDEMRTKYGTALFESVTDNGVRDPRYKTALRAYLAGKAEMRDLLAGSQTISWSQGPAGGYQVDFQFRNQIEVGLKQVSPLFRDDVVSLIREPGFAMNPKKLSGWDLTSIASVAVPEATFQAPTATPIVSGKILSGYTHRVSLAESIEADEDIQGSAEKTSQAAAIGFAQGMGNFLVNGTGIQQPSGVYTSATPSGVLLGSGNYRSAFGYVDQVELEQVMFSVNRIHRASPKCCWLMSDGSWQKIRSSLYDSSSRVLLSIENDNEMLLGKRVLLEPNLPTGANSSPIVSGEILFGDFSHFFVRLSNISAQRTLQTATSQKDLTFGSYLWHFRMRVDSTLYDPSSGNSSPIVSAFIHP